jgi:hypothetical protein
MSWVQHAVTTAPEIFLLLAVGIGSAGAMTVDAAVSGACDVAESQTPVLGVAVPYAIANVFLMVLGPIIVGLTFVG